MITGSEENFLMKYPCKVCIICIIFVCIMFVLYFAAINLRSSCPQSKAENVPTVPKFPGSLIELPRPLGSEGP